MGILEAALTVILKAFAWVTTSGASKVAYEALTAVMNLILKIASSLGLKSE
ncbi:MAG: hypothetical protein IKR49_09905 [Clostridia bacterium]|nr:hypothetical protein [Clostridia bacterium]